jgi:uncharacterized protein
MIERVASPAEEPSPPPLSSSSEASRVLGFDVARALACAGMMTVNFKIVLAGVAPAMGEASPEWLARIEGAFEGRASATFVVLAGAGLSLMSRRARESGDRALLASNRRTLLGRALFLFVAGLLYYPLWPGDILHYYGVYIALGALLLGAGSVWLWSAAAGAALAWLAMLGALDYEAGWNWTTFEYSGFWTPAGFARNLFFNGFHPVFPWVAFLFAGMWLGRQKLAESPRRRRSVLMASVALVALIEGLSSALVGHFLAHPSVELSAEDAQALFGTASMPPTPLYLLAAGATAFAVVCLAIEAGQRFPKAFWVKPLAATGQLALTLYVAHVVIGMGVLVPFGELKDYSVAFALGWAASFCGLSILFATIWRKRFERGPLEWLMRRVAG